MMRSAAVVGLAAFGVSTNASASSGYTAYDDEYRSVVNVVDAGADNSGVESITPVLESERSDNTLFYFPPGRYAMDSQFRFTGFKKFGVVGEDATLVPGDYYTFEDSPTRLFRLGTSTRPGGNVRFENFQVDQTAPDTGIRVIDTYAKDYLEVRNVRIHGEHDSGTSGPGHFNLTRSSGTGIVERFRAPDGGAWVHNTPNNGNNWRGPIGIEANRNEGTLTFRRCWIHGFPSNGLYASGGSGKIIVNGGWYKNNNGGANVRVGGNGSEIRYPTIEVDYTREDDQSQRGIRLENGRDLLVRGAKIEITSPMPTSHAISVQGSCDSATIENSTIAMSGNKINHGIVVSGNAGETLIQYSDITHDTAGGYPIWIRETDNNDRVLLRGVSISGEAGDAAGFRDGIRCGRDNCRFSSCEVDQRGLDGVNRNALVVTGSDTSVYKGTFRADRFPYIDQGSSNLLRNADLESHRGSVEAVRLYSSSTNPVIMYNRLVNGIDDLGATGLVTYGNEEE